MCGLMRCVNAKQNQNTTKNSLWYGWVQQKFGQCAFQRNLSIFLDWRKKAKRYKGGGVERNVVEE